MKLKIAVLGVGIVLFMMVANFVSGAGRFSAVLSRYARALPSTSAPAAETQGSSSKKVEPVTVNLAPALPRNLEVGGGRTYTVAELQAINSNKNLRFKSVASPTRKLVHDAVLGDVVEITYANGTRLYEPNDEIFSGK